MRIYIDCRHAAHVACGPQKTDLTSADAPRRRPLRLRLGAPLRGLHLGGLIVAGACSPLSLGSARKSLARSTRNFSDAPPARPPPSAALARRQRGEAARDVEPAGVEDAVQGPDRVLVRLPAGRGVAPRSATACASRATRSSTASTSREGTPLLDRWRGWLANGGEKLPRSFKAAGMVDMGPLFSPRDHTYLLVNGGARRASPSAAPRPSRSRCSSARSRAAARGGSGGGSGGGGGGVGRRGAGGGRAAVEVPLGAARRVPARRRRAAAPLLPPRGRAVGAGGAARGDGQRVARGGGDVRRHDDAIVRRPPRRRLRQVGRAVHRPGDAGDDRRRVWARDRREPLRRLHCGGAHLEPRALVRRGGATHLRRAPRTADAARAPKGGAPPLHPLTISPTGHHSSPLAHWRPLDAKLDEPDGRVLVHNAVAIARAPTTTTMDAMLKRNVATYPLELTLRAGVRAVLVELGSMLRHSPQWRRGIQMVSRQGRAQALLLPRHLGRAAEVAAAGARPARARAARAAAAAAAAPRPERPRA